VRHQRLDSVVEDVIVDTVTTVDVATAVVVVTGGILVDVEVSTDDVVSVVVLD